MKTKQDKPMIPDKDAGKNEAKNAPKVPIKPKFISSKGLTSCKSEKDLKSILEKRDDQVESIIESQGPSSMIQIGEPNKREKKILKQIVKPELARLNSPKLQNQLSPKSNGLRFFRSSNVVSEKEEDINKKKLQEKQQKLQMLEKRNEELETKLQTLDKEKQKTKEIVEQLKNQKQSLEKNLQKFKNVAQQNRKLLKQKVEGFNNNGNQIINLRNQLEELKMSRSSSSTCEIGINTQVEEEKPTETVDDTPENLSPKIQESIIEVNNSKTSEIQEPLECFNVLNGINFDENQKLALTKNVFQKFIADLNTKMKERQETIYELQIQLNELYQKLQNKQSPQKLLNADEILLLQIKQNQEIKQKLTNQQKKVYELKDQIWNKQREIDSLKREIQVKQILYQSDLGRTLKSEQQRNYDNPQMEALKRQVHKLKVQVCQDQSRIKSLEERNTQQDTIIKSLRQKKSKIIK